MSSAVESTSKPFEPDTTGWTARDLDDPAIEREWFRGRYEIVEGVLTKMPPAYFTGHSALFKLMMLLQQHFTSARVDGSFAGEVDVIIDDVRVAVADAVFLTTDQRRRQDEATRRAGKEDVRRARILVPPLLVIESVSPGHEQHDRRTKLRWYAEFGVVNYWILDAFARKLECFVLRGGDYALDHSADGEGEVAPGSFPGLVIRLRDLWQE